MPDAFQEGLQVVVDGRMDGQGTFQGRELIVKCPSKYESKSKGPETASASESDARKGQEK